jgi:hypothetical protein
LPVALAVAAIAACQGDDEPAATATPVEPTATATTAPASPVSSALVTATATPAPATATRAVSATPTPPPAATPAATPGAGINCGGPDTDGDRLADCYERAIGTSAIDPDTDGDGLTDYQEVVNMAFDAATNNYQFNPLIADMPQISFVLTSVPEISVNYTTTDQKSFSITNTESTETARQVTSSETSEESTALEVGGKDPFPRGTVSVTNSWSKAQSSENRKAHSEALTATSGSEVQSTGGSIAVTLSVRNRGFQVITLESLTVAALQSSPRQSGGLTPVGNLQFDGQFSPIEIGPNRASPGTLIFSRELSLGRALDLLADSDSIVLEASAWRATDPDGRSYTHSLTDIGSKDALVVVDYGPRYERETGRAKESYYVSTVADFDAKRITAAQAMRDILRIPYTTGTAAWAVAGQPSSTHSGLLSVRGVGTDPKVRGRWQVVYGSLSESGAAESVTVLDNLQAAYNFDRIELRKSYSLLLSYVEDADGDGVFSREEFLRGTLDNKADTDSDGLTDFDEIKSGWDIPLARALTRTVHSDPLTADADEDGLEDSQEKQRGMDPRNRDTDGDGVRDSNDTPVSAGDMYERAYFAFDGNLNAVVGSAATASMTGPTFGADRNARARSALYLNGTWKSSAQPGQLSEAPAGSTLTVAGAFPAADGNGAAWAFWLRPEVFRQQGIFNSQAAPFVRERVMMWMEANGALSSGADDIGRHLAFTRTPVSEPEEWIHLAGVLSDSDNTPGAERFSLYINGLLVTSLFDPRECCVTVPAADWRFGVTSPLVPDGSVKTSFQGWLDELWLFSRALSPAEVAALYRAP